MIEVLSYFDVAFDRHHLASDLALLVITLFFSILSYYLVRHFIAAFIATSSKQYNSKTKLTIRRKHLPQKVALILPYYLLLSSLSLIITKVTTIGSILNALFEIGAAVIVLKAFFALFDFVLIVLANKHFGHRLPLHGLIQFLKLAFVAITILITTSHILDRTPIYLISGISVVAGMLAFIMKDTILGFIAGIQLAANKMISTGEWIQLDNHKVDGTVQEVTLTTVKVKNWDNTIAMIPSQTLVSEPFINWYGVEETGARRIKRAIFIDVESIDFLDKELRQHMEHFRLLKPYIVRKQQEIDAYNKTLASDSHPLNFRRMTNLGCFREYIACYLSTPLYQGSDDSGAPVREQ